MKRNGKKFLVFGIGLVIAFAIWTVLIKTVDVKPVGQNGSSIGFAWLNTKFFAATGVHMTLYTVTDWLGIVPVCACAAFAIIGFCQMIKRKSLLKVDSDIILLGVYYAAVMFFYLIFEMFPVNYRPVLIDGVAEASYPSSTTLLVLSVMPTLSFEAKRRIRNAAAANVIVYLTAAFSAFTVIGRLV